MRLSSGKTKGILIAIVAVVVVAMAATSMMIVAGTASPAVPAVAVSADTSDAVSPVAPISSAASSASSVNALPALDVSSVGTSSVDSVASIAPVSSESSSAVSSAVTSVSASVAPVSSSAASTVSAASSAVSSAASSSVASSDTSSDSSAASSASSVASTAVSSPAPDVSTLPGWTAQSGQYMRVAVNTINIRSAPSLSASVVTQLPLDTLLTADPTNESDGFIAVNYQGHVAFAFVSYLKNLVYPDGVNFTAPEYVVKAGETTAVNVYQQPDTSAPLAGSIYGGTVVCSVLSQEGDYSFVSAENGGVRGYIPTASLTQVTPDQTWGMIVDKGSQTTEIFQNNVPVRVFPCTTGATDTETPAGVYLIGDRLPYFYSGDLICYNALRINNQIYFHRIPCAPGNNYSAFAALLGVKASHGCIRVPIDQSTWMYDNIPRSTKVYIVEG